MGEMQQPIDMGIGQAAKEYAISHTTTRCANLGNHVECAKCKVRTCDYKSRYMAYYDGATSQFLKQLTVLKTKDK